MQSIKYTDYPKEQDELMEILTKDYEFVAEEYPVAWKFREFLKRLGLCDFSEILDDVYLGTDYRNNPMIMCRRVIFFSCRQKDMERLSYVAARFGKEFLILDDNGYIVG